MKIAYIAVKGIPMSGGIEKYTEEMAKHLAVRGHEVTVYTTSHYGNVNGMRDGYFIRVMPSLRGKGIEKLSLVLCASVDQLFRSYDIVHYHALGPSVFAFLAQLRGRKVVIQSHGIEYKRAKWGKAAATLLKLLERLSYNMGDTLTVVSLPIQRYFLQTYHKQTVFIPTGVELPNLADFDENILQDRGLNAGGYYFFIARIVQEKGLHYLLEAFQKLDTNKKLVVAGKMDPQDSYHQKLREMAQSDDRIVFTGEVLGKEKDMLFKGAYAFCLPSELEGMSIALLEAMSYRKLCIVSDIPENMDVAQGRALSFVNKNVDSLLQALRQAEALSTAERERYQAAAGDYVMENHQFADIAQQMEDLYRSL